VALLGLRESIPSVNQVFGAGQHFFLRQKRDAKHVSLGLDAGDFGVELFKAESQLLVPRTESLLVQNVCLVQLDQLVSFASDFLPFGVETRKKLFKGVQLLVAEFHMVGNLRRREDKRPKLFLENLLQVIDRNLVAAVLAGVLRAVRGHIHRRLALAEREPGEEMNHALCLALAL